MSRHGNRPVRRASVYLLALLVVLVVSGIAVVMARGAGVRLHLHQQAIAQVQCRAAAMGVVRAVLNDLTTSMAKGQLPSLLTVAAAGETVGDCTVLLIGRDPSGRRATFGLIADAGRIGVTSLADATVAQRGAEAAALSSLPGMTTAIVAALRDWCDADDIPDADGGAERTAGAYLGAAVPYAPRNAPMEGLEEVRMVRDVTDALYFGEDANQNGRLDAGEIGSGDGSVALGLRDLLTLENREPPQVSDNTPPTNLANTTELKARLTALFGTSRAEDLAKSIQVEVTALGRPFNSRLEMFCALADVLSDAEADTLWPWLIGPERRVGLIDAWSCPDVLLSALVGNDLATTIIKARPSTPPTGPSWLVQALSGQQIDPKTMTLLTCGSYQFHADVLAVRNDGAGWVRLDVAIDGSSGTARITSLRNAEALGWPLPWCPPEQLRQRGADQNPIALLTTDTK